MKMTLRFKLELLFVVVLATSFTAAVSSAATPAWFGDVVSKKESPLPDGFGGRPHVVAWTPDSKQLIVVRKVKLDDIRIMVLRLDRKSRTFVRLKKPGDCLTSKPVSGCTTLAPVPRDVSEVVVAPDGGTVYVVGQGVLTLRRDVVSGALSVPENGSSCVSLSYSICGQPGDPVTLTLTKEGSRAFGLVGRRLVVLAKDPATGVLTSAEGPGRCLSDGVVEGCTPARGTGWTGGSLAVSPDGRDLYAAANKTGSFVVLHARVSDDGTLVQPDGENGLPVVREKACELLDPGTSEDESIRGERDCVTPTVLMPADGSHLYITAPTSFTVAPSPVSTYMRSKETGALTFVKCRGDCSTTGQPDFYNRPVALSPDGKNLYALDRRAEGDAFTSYLTPLTRDTKTGLFQQFRSVNAKTNIVANSIVLYGREIAVSPDGAWLVSDRLTLVMRRTKRPPSVSVKGLPTPNSSCNRRAVTLRVKVRGRDKARPVKVLAYEEPYEGEGLEKLYVNRKLRSSSFKVKVPKSLADTFRIEVPGRDGNDIAYELTLRFCR